jgi:hypothetical protein
MTGLSACAAQPGPEEDGILADVAPQRGPAAGWIRPGRAGFRGVPDLPAAAAGQPPSCPGRQGPRGQVQLPVTRAPPAPVRYQGP